MLTLPEDVEWFISSKVDKKKKMKTPQKRIQGVPIVAQHVKNPT